MTQLLERWKAWANRLKIEVYALYMAYGDPRTPWCAKVVAACVVGYAFSPIDLIPDFIPLNYPQRAGQIHDRPRPVYSGKGRAGSDRRHSSHNAPFPSDRLAAIPALRDHSKAL